MSERMGASGRVGATSDVVPPRQELVPVFHDEWLTVYGGDARTVLRELPAESVHCVVTSPPYWGLRDYGMPGQMGLESTPDYYVGAMVEVFRLVRRVLRDDGTVWLNLGDTYYRDPARGDQEKGGHAGLSTGRTAAGAMQQRARGVMPEKNLIGIPWRVALALQADGWILRCDVIWNKPAVMPSSVTDRPTRSHEYVFLLAKAHRYYFDAAAVREEDSGSDHPRKVLSGQPSLEPTGGLRMGRNIRSVWTIATAPYPGAHFATFPPKLVEPMILAGCPSGGTVLDPFAGTGTVGMVAAKHSRRAVLIDLNPDYLRQCLARNAQTPLGLPA